MKKVWQDLCNNFACKLIFCTKYPSMKKLLFALIGGSFLASLFLIGGCKLSSSSPNYTEFAINVDSIQHPDTINYGKSLVIKFYGTIGPSTCYSFSHFAGNVSTHQVNVQVLGKYIDQSNCASETQYLNGDSLTLNQVDSGNFVIHVYRDTTADISDTVFVKHTVMK